MPHDVIMPALGMAQDTGLIVAWHKSEGDAVTAEDTLFEVETDKATMEVAAGADGFLTRIRAQAGDEVPVGDVIAVIGDSTEAINAEEPPASAPAQPQTVEGNQVIMPALGMAQDTGLIVAWHKAPGDAVAATDVLFEVETDKATMDVEAGYDGYVAALLAEAGEEAPVGDVIAVISDEKPENPVQSSANAKAAPARAPAATASPPAEKDQPVVVKKPASFPKPAPIASGERVLASPKARRLALEQGLDLSRLAAAGIAMPYHVADLETLRTLPDPSAATAGGEAALHVTACVAQDGFVSFTDWLGGQAGRAAVWASFAAASLRAATGAAELTVRVDQPLVGRASFFADPDLGPMSAIAGVQEDGTPSLVLRDVTGSRVTGGVFGASDALALTVATDGDDFVLTLDYAAGQLDTDAAIALIEGFAARLQEPMRHLL